MVVLEAIEPRWSGGLCVIAATGPSLTVEVAIQVAVKGCRVIAVNDAWRLLPFADILYACDRDWWMIHNGCPDFKGEKWSSHDPRANDKRKLPEEYGIRLVRGRREPGFSLDPRMIHYGDTSSYQAINLAILLGVRTIILVGMDMRTTNPKHFFGDHPSGLKNSAKFEYFIPQFVEAASLLPDHIRIINCTPRSALTCFPQMELRDAL